MKSVNFRGKSYFVGKEIPVNTKKHIGFFFNRYHDRPNDEVSWYFIRIDQDWLTHTAGKSWIEYYAEANKHMLKFDDQIESGEFFSEDEDEYQITYYEAITLKDTLKEL